MRCGLFAWIALLLSAATIGGNETRRPVWEKDPGSNADRFCIAVNAECLGLIDSAGNVIARFGRGRSQIHDFFNDRMPMGDPEFGEFGYIDPSGGWAIPPKFAVARPFCNGFAIVRESWNGPWQFIDIDGRHVGPTAEFSLDVFTRGLAPVRRAWADPAGYIDQSGEWAIPPTFQHAARFSPDGIAAVQDQRGLWGYIDAYGHYLIEPQYFRARQFHEGRAAVTPGETCWSRVQVTHSATKYQIWRLGNPSMVSEEPNELPECRWVLINAAGEPLSDLVFSWVDGFSEGAAAARLGEKWGILGRNGQWISPPVWQKTANFSEGLAAVQDEDAEWGYVNRRGEVVVEPQYQIARAFSEGLAVVYGKDRRAFYIRPDGSRAFSRNFAQAGSFQRGIANVAIKANQSFAYIDKTGKTIFEYSNPNLPSD